MGTIVRYARATHPQSSRPAPQSVKKKKENATRAPKTKASDAGLEDFVDWTSIISIESVEEKEMSNLTAGFAARMCKRAASSEGETTPRSGVKWSRRSSPNE